MEIEVTRTMINRTVTMFRCNIDEADLELYQRDPYAYQDYIQQCDVMLEEEIQDEFVLKFDRIVPARMTAAEKLLAKFDALASGTDDLVAAPEPITWDPSGLKEI